MQKAYQIGYYVVQLLLRLLIVYFLFAICRLAFYLVNLDAFPELATGDLFTIFITALRFDTAAIVYTNALFILSYILPLPWREKAWYQKGQLILFLSFNFLAVLLELIDAGFFSFSFRRSGQSDLKMMANSFQVTPRYLLDYWYLVLLLIGALYALYWLYNRVQLSRQHQAAPLISQILVFLVAIPLGIVAARGGLQLRPVMPIMASDYVEDVRLAPLVSNTTLNMIFSSQQRFIEIPNYLPEQEIAQIFPPVQEKGDSMLRKNVVVLVLESFGEGNVGYFQEEEISDTPFFDSLYAQCWKAPKAFANGLRSTQGIVAISAGIPSLMEDPLMFSAYQSNKTESIADLLARQGYTTAFFHGSNPGSMLFESFAQTAGFQKFYDKTDYDNEADYDGNWGIWDRPFFQYFAQTINEYPQPFFAQFFSLTSHHPYAVEPAFAQRYPNLDPVRRCYRYTDEALRAFFSTAQQMPWYSNTLFVLCADHVGPGNNDNSYTRTHRYRIPIGFFDPSVSKDSLQPQQKVLQQIDILPSIMDYLHYPESFNTLGTSLFDSTNTAFSMMYTESQFQILNEQYLLLFDGKMVNGLFDYTIDPYHQNNLLEEQTALRKTLEQRLKAAIQRHHYAMVKNRWPLEK